MSWQLASFAILAAVLFGGFAWYERSRPPSQIVALVAALAALAVAGRLALAAIPNVVATTDIVIFSGFALGAAPGFVVGALAGLISNFWLGQGPWTPWQMAGWGLCGMGGALLALGTGRRGGRIELTVACGFAGIAYGALLNFSLMVGYGGDLTLDRFLTLEARAVPFDLAHAIGNMTLALVAGPAMVRMLMRFRKRFEFRWTTTRGLRQPAGTRVGATGISLLLVLAAALGATGGGIPESRAGDHAPAARWLERAMNPDGGFPATPGQDSSAEMTGWAMLGLESAGINPRDLGRAGRSPVDFLRRNIGETRSPGDLARTILALRGAGIDPRHFAGRDLAAKLAGRRRPNGSYVGWPGSTAFAVMALRASGLRAGLARSLAWLRQVQSAEGGWGAVPAGHSDPDTTGAVLQALAGGSRATTRGLRYLRRTQRPGGGWALAESGPTNSQSTAWAIQGLLAAGIKPSSVKRGGRNGLEYLAARQARDGHYRYSSSSDQTPVWVTAQALVAAQRKPFPLAPVPQMPGSGGGRAGGGEAGASGSHSESGGEGAGVNGSGKGGAGEGAPHPSLTRHSRERREQSAAGSPARSDAKRSGGASPPPATARDQLNSATATLAADKPQGGSDDGGTSSLLAPVAIAVAAAAAVLACGWGAARRLRA